MKKLFLFICFYLMCGQLSAQTGLFISSDNFSSSLISELCQDNYGSIWIATDYGLNRYDGYRFSSFLHNDKDPNSISVNAVVTLFSDRDGRLWVGTNRGLDRFDANTNSFIHYPFPYGLHPRVSSIIHLKDGTIMVGTAGYGVYTIKDNQLQPYRVEGVDNFYSRLFEDSRGRIWKSSFDDKITMWSSSDNKKVKTFLSEVGNPQRFIEYGDEVLILCMHGLMSYRNGIMSVADIDLGNMQQEDVVFRDMVIDHNNNIYISTRGRGLYRVSTTNDRHLERVDVDAIGIDVNTARIVNMMFDRSGNLWLACLRKGILMMPQRPEQFRNWSFTVQSIPFSSSITSVCEGDGGMTWCAVQGVGIFGFNERGHVVAHPSAPNAVECIYRDKMGRYWIGTDDAFFAYDPLTGRSQLKMHFDCDRINDMTCDDQGNLYISTFSRGFCVFDPNTGTSRCYDANTTDTVHGRLCNNWIMCMMPDRKGKIWMGTSSGVSCFDPKTHDFLSEGWPLLLPGVMCFSICELHDENIVIGTEDGLYFYERKTRQLQPFPGAEVLSNMSINYIVESNDGDIWCATSNGIWQYDNHRKTFIGHVNGNGLTKREYLYGVGMHNNDDLICFGHNDGFTVFQPKDIKESVSSLEKLRLTAFLVGNVSVNASTVINGVRVTEKAVLESDYFTLSYLDHTITLAFSQLNFDNPANVIFECRVNDGEWMRNPEGENSFTLSHLQPGTYRIQARARVGNNYTPEKVIVVIVRAPWYRTLLAYFIYAVVLLSLIGFVAYNYRRHANEQMNEEKMKFLINATHDIRSPLTLITSPLNHLKRCVDMSQQDVRRDIDVIERNAQRILNLVNQILDVRKIDKQQMHLHCQETDLVAFTRSICKMFEYNAGERNIQFSFDSDKPQIDAWIDRSQFDKVISNLLSNAFKYSYEGGQISVRLTHDEQQLKLQVIDNGIGLGGDNLKHIFDRFYQGGNSRRMHIDGTGIGLNLCKMIVDMHHGTIEAGNRLDGQRGSVFTVTLPLGNEHLTQEEIEVPSEATQSSAPRPQTAARCRVLIVDDDLEIGHYISTELAHYYRFGICSNGKEGLKELLTNDYDVVVSDVMMPEMDGFTMLRMIKTNLNISDIPVIMLTSKADVGNRLEGLERGADAFLAKPFDMEELHMVIENLIHNRQRLKGKYSGAQQQADKVEQPEVKGNDELLMERIMKAVNKNLSDSDFNVDMLTREVGISRAQLHRKMKELTGLTTSEFIRNIRLEQAARLLREQKVNVTQVAYTVGFSNLAHFSTIFRKHFGVTPSEYAEKGGVLGDA